MLKYPRNLSSGCSSQQQQWKNPRWFPWELHRSRKNFSYPVVFFDEKKDFSKCHLYLSCSVGIDLPERPSFAKLGWNNFLLLSLCFPLQDPKPLYASLQHQDPGMFVKVCETHYYGSLCKQRMWIWRYFAVVSDLTANSHLSVKKEKKKRKPHRKKKKNPSTWWIK